MVDYEALSDASGDEVADVDSTNVRLDGDAVNAMKKAVGVSKNTEVAPAIEAAIFESLGMDDEAEEAEERFKEQFEDE